MNILILTIPITLTLVLIFILLFVLAVKKGQFDDLETPSHSPLLDETHNGETQTSFDGEKP